MTNQLPEQDQDAGVPIRRSSGGAPNGNSNAVASGAFTKEAIAQRRACNRLLREWSETVNQAQKKAPKE